jgi:AbrB family looped-hinge helix DNA binding protein
MELAIFVLRKAIYYACEFEVAMEMVRISTKFRVVIPKRVREDFNLKPGEELDVCVINGSIQLQRKPSVTKLRGAAKGLKWKNDYRDRLDRI